MKCSSSQSRDFPAACGEDQGEAGYFHAVCGGPYTGAGGHTLKEAEAPAEDHTGTQ